jgi:hypothetical protein
MADEKNTPEHSGSRWEPGADDDTRQIAAGTDQPPARPTAEPTADQPPAAQPAPGPAYATPPSEAAPPAAGKPRLRARSIGYPVAAAIAAGLVVVSGVGGYALGAATAGDDLDRVSFQRGGLPPGGPGGWGDRDDDGDGRGFMPGPPPGADGPMPGFPDQDGDGPDGLDDSDGSDGSDGGTQDSGTTT